MTRAEIEQAKDEDADATMAMEVQVAGKSGTDEEDQK